MKGKFKKIVFVIFLLFSFSIRLSAPDRESLIIFRALPVEPYKRIIQAIGKVETNFDTLAYNPAEKATGYFQIRPVRLEDYNKRTGSNYKMKDMFDYKISEKVFMVYWT